MKKQKKNVVRDICDGKIIKDKEAVSLDNIELYLEKNGMKLVYKILMLLSIISVSSINVHADIGALDLTLDNHVFIFVTILFLSYLISVFSLLAKIEMLSNIFGIIILLSGFILIISGFNIILSICIVISAILILIGVDT